MVTLYAICAVVGGLLLLAALIFGEIGFGHVDIPWLSTPAAAAAVGGFGAIGWPLTAGTGLPAGVIAAIAGVGAVVIYLLLMAALRGMRRSQGAEVAGLRAAVGRTGTVVLPIAAGGWGQVSYLDAETVRSVAVAVTTDPGAPVPSGAAVLIVDVDGDRLVVQPLELPGLGSQPTA